ncbi:MAG: sulfatase-like hydrolase/transferase [Actinomycetota bacterium]
MVGRPNLLLITTDQHRWDWLGCHGTPGVETPNIDRLAASGVRFTEHVTNSAVCAPARIGLAAGTSPHRLGVFTNGDVLPDATPTYYQALRDAGYRVGCVGKLDLNKPEKQNGPTGDRPETYRWGFTDPVEVEGKMHAAMGRGEPLGPYGWWLREQGLFDGFVADYHTRLHEIINKIVRGPDDPPYEGVTFMADSVLPTHAFADSYIGRRSREWLRDAPEGRPWHLFVSFVGPHDPYDPPAEYAERFRRAPVPAPTLDPSDRRPQAVRLKEYGNTEDELVDARRQYSASLALIDDQIGEILATAEDRADAENTIVIFTADHGDMLGDHRLFQKTVPYEAAVRIPLIVNGPGITAGSSDALTELIDVTATLLDLADVDPIAPIDGRSLVPLLTNPSLHHRDAGVICEGPSRTLRTATHKYSHHVAVGWDTHELYDLVADPDETTNLIEDEPSLAAELRVDLEARVGAEVMAG